MTNYMICDENGNALTDGVQECEARQIAQSMADNRLESVWLSESDSTEMGEEFEPCQIAGGGYGGEQGQAGRRSVSPGYLDITPTDHRLSPRTLTGARSEGY
jgi:hypothetical protein